MRLPFWPGYLIPDDVSAKPVTITNTVSCKRLKIKFCLMKAKIPRTEVAEHSSAALQSLMNHLALQVHHQLSRKNHPEEGREFSAKFSDQIRSRVDRKPGLRQRPTPAVRSGHRRTRASVHSERKCSADLAAESPRRGRPQPDGHRVGHNS